MVVPFPAGSATDAIARVIAAPLSQALGQPVIVENKAGADGAIAATDVARANPDGHTLLLATNSPMAAIPSMRKTPPYDAINDFAPISLAGYYSFYLMVHPSVPAKTLKELIDYAKINPGKLNYATGNSTGIMSTLQLMWLAGIKMTHVPYKGEPQAVTDVLNGQIQVMFATWTTTAGHIKDGRIRPIATSLKQRTIYLPDVPTMTEAGLSQFNVLSWAALFAPAKTPIEIVERLNRELVAAAKRPDIREHFAKIAVEPATSTPDELGAFVKDQIDVWKKTMAAASVAPE
ncbi:MAG: tripartite tricarboxylate transporter substrate binding protein [Betaproteobacteria bacterium]|nr:tripartite tricarboxylate transporter substrate binding protein [Betaproteobacteria bacterium]